MTLTTNENRKPAVKNEPHMQQSCHRSFFNCMPFKSYFGTLWCLGLVVPLRTHGKTNRRTSCLWFSFFNSWVHVSQSCPSQTLENFSKLFLRLEIGDQKSKYEILKMTLPETFSKSHKNKSNYDFQDMLYILSAVWTHLDCKISNKSHLHEFHYAENKKSSSAFEELSENLCQYISRHNVANE